MFLIDCPYCGMRDQSEFSNAGEAHRIRETRADDMTDAQWADFLFMRKNTKGLYAERWYHAAGCRKFFNQLRNSASDEVLATYKIGAKPPKVTTALPNTPAGEPPIGSGNDAVKIMSADEAKKGKAR